MAASELTVKPIDQQVLLVSSGWRIENVTRFFDFAIPGQVNRSAPDV